MKKISSMNILMFASVFILLTACGAGGGGVNSQTRLTKASVTLSTAVTYTIPADTTVNIYEVTLALPTGVTVKASPDAGNPSILVPDNGVVTATANANGATISSVYTAAVGTTTPAMVYMQVIKADNMNPGEFSKVNCDITYAPKASDFGSPTLKVYGIYTNPTNTSDQTTVDLTSYMTMTLSVKVY